MFEPGDVHGLTHAMRRVIENPGLARRWGRQARQHMLTRGDWNEIAGRVALLYHQLLPISPSPS
jgi:hypothetical protein